jgi:prepilin-type N-terminal cleavage/methylation domain-containing protein
VASAGPWLDRLNALPRHAYRSGFQLTMRRSSRDPRWGQRGVSLIELIVVILIIAILTAIAIAVFLNQRERAMVSQVQSALRGAANKAESYGLDKGGSFVGVDVVALETQGLRVAPPIGISIAGNSSGYCIIASHFELSVDHPWQTASYWSGEGRPLPDDGATCIDPEAPSAPSAPVRPPGGGGGGGGGGDGDASPSPSPSPSPF